MSYPRQVEESERLTQKIRFFQRESRALIDQLSKLKLKLNDTTLANMSHHANILTNPIKIQSYRTLKGHFNKVLAMAWHPDNVHILSASQDGFMIVWDSVTGLKNGIISLEDPWVSCCDISLNGRLVASGGLNDCCYIYKLNGMMNIDNENSNNNNNNNNRINGMNDFDDYNLNSPTTSSDTGVSSSIISIMKGHKEYISDCGFVSNSQILTSSGDRSCNLWDIDKGMKIASFNDHIGDVLELSINKAQSETSDSNGDVVTNMFATCSSDGLANIWDIRQRSHVRQYQVSDTFDSSSIRFSPNGYSLACGCDDGQIKLFDLRADSLVANYPIKEVIEHMHGNGTEIGMNQEFLGPNFSLLSKSGQLSDTTSNRSLRQKMQLEINESIDNPGVLSLDFSKSSRLMFVSYNDYSDLMVWDSITGKVIDHLSGHKGVISKVRVSNDGEGICTCSRDHTLRVWSSV